MDSVVVIGAGVGGLAAAMSLAHAGVEVTIFDRHATPGGKMRVVDSLAGPVDAGPTVLTMLPFFEAIFERCGASLDAEVTLRPLEVLARHHWPDGSTLDLYAQYERSRDAIAAFAGDEAARQFARFHQGAGSLFRAFEGPMMRAAEPSALRMTGTVARRPWLVPALSPGRSLSQSLRARFTDRRLRQLFARYSTYVGGYPNASPALLSLIWYAESQGVWTVEGGMHALAHAMQRVAQRAGATFRLGTAATEVATRDGRAVAIRTEDGDEIEADAVVFNGDPKALRHGLMGPALRDVVPDSAVARRSLSAFVWAFAGTPAGHAPIHHNVYFGQNPEAEFEDIERGQMPRDPTLYLHAQDRDGNGGHSGMERFEIIMNGPPRSGTTRDEAEAQACRRVTFETLARMGLRFQEEVPLDALTAPEDFNRLFPGSDGALYGLSPHGMAAAFRRPRARTEMPGLYICGGGAHPGAGIPMASLSGLHAAEAVVQDLTSPTPPRPGVAVHAAATRPRRTIN